MSFIGHPGSIPEMGISTQSSHHNHLNTAVGEAQRKSTSFTDLFKDMKVNICAHMDSPSLKAMMEVSQEMHDTIATSIFLQNKILHDFALGMALLLIDKDYLQSRKPHVLALKIDKYGNVFGLEDILNADKNHLKYKTLGNIAISLAKNDDIARSKEIFDSIKEQILQVEQIPDIKSLALQSVAVAQTKSGDITGAKETVSLINYSHLKSEVLQGIAVSLAKNDDMVGAKETIPLIKGATFEG